jgi:glycosyltransferase involved in cell wall biosynthesis
VLDIRDLYPDCLFQAQLLKQDGVLGRTLQWLTGYFYDGAAGIVTVTEHLAQGIQARTRQRPIHLVRNGFDSRLFQPQRERFPEFTCVTHGILGRIHDLQLLIDAARIVSTRDPQIRFLVIGMGPKIELLRHNRPANLQHIPSLPYLQIPQTVGRCHLGLSLCMDIPHSEWTFPVRVYEFLGLGLWTIVAPRHCEAAEILESRRLGEAIPNSPELLAERILQLSQGSVPEPDPDKIAGFSRQLQALQFRRLVERAISAGCGTKKLSDASQERDPDRD